MAPTKTSEIADDAKSDQSTGSKSKRRLFGWFRGGGQATPRRKKTADAAATHNVTPSDRTPKTSNAASKEKVPPQEGRKIEGSSIKEPAGILKKEIAPVAKTKKISSPSLQKASSWFCRTSHFYHLCDMAFEAVDADQSGTVDESELYAGLLLIHLKLGTYAGPAACRPLSRERCQAMFRKMDLDGSGSLDKAEFRNVMAVLFGNVVLRVLVQWSMTLMIVPFVAQAILNGVAWLTEFIFNTIASLDEQSEVANSTEITVEGATAWCVARTPSTLVSAGTRLSNWLAMVPESVWHAIPLTLISTVLGIVVVPWCIFQVDDFFQRLADSKAKQKLENGQWL
jgi:hypothetical protein